MGCQKDIAEKITKAEADYVLGLKGNQTTLHDDVRLYFENATQNPQFYDGNPTCSTMEKGHGRFEKRYYCHSEDIDWLTQKPEWEGLKSIGMVLLL